MDAESPGESPERPGVLEQLEQILLEHPPTWGLIVVAITAYFDDRATAKVWLDELPGDALVSVTGRREAMTALAMYCSPATARECLAALSSIEATVGEEADTWLPILRLRSEQA